ncbi:MAG: threonyl-tRNA synthetase editing domain-containing protein [Planctomycetota bacterium]|jgi:hypothetical protein
MILDCYQCSTCYFEDREASSRIDPATISARQPREVFENVLLVFICIELYDGREELQEAADEFGALSDLIGKRPIVLCPNVHLSIDQAPAKQAARLVTELENMLVERKYTVHRLSFGYHKQYGMECNGNVGSIVGRRFYGSEQKRLLRFLTRLGVCPPDPLPADTPSWARALTERQLRVLSNRRETYDAAKKMLSDQLDAAAHSELWTCMLFEGERQPLKDYVSTLQGIIDDYPDVRIHRAVNLSVPGLSNQAGFLFRKFPEAIKSGRLRIYNSNVSDLEFLLTKTAVLLAFPQMPRRAGSHRSESTAATKTSPTT